MTRCLYKQKISVTSFLGGARRAPAIQSNIRYVSRFHYFRLLYSFYIFRESVLRLFLVGHHNSSRLRAVHRWTIHTRYRTYVVYSCLELTCFHHFLVAFYARLCVPQLLLCLISPLCQLTRSGEPALSQKVNALPCATSKIGKTFRCYQ